MTLIPSRLAVVTQAPSGDTRPPKRIGLVLGAGGPVGHAYHSGVLHALHDVLEWDARKADVVVGTSAGAQVAALLRANLAGEDLFARVSGTPMRAHAAAIARHYIRPCHRTPDERLPKQWKPGSLRYLLSALRRPLALRPGRMLSALSPTGRVPLDAQAEGLRRIFGHEWPAHELWITAVALDTGERVAFGSEGAPAIDVGTAVTCLGSVPGINVPVTWRGARYVDGGVASATHLDLLHSRRLDLIIVSAPLSMFGVMRALLRRETKRLERVTPVALFEPDRPALATMGRNPMAIEKSAVVAKAAYEATLRSFDDLRTRERLDLVF